jgi:metal-responsive CopG/Arc/MetJ family transcriptional regulator
MPTEMKILSCAVPSDLAEALGTLQARHGTTVSETVRRALRAYLEKQKVLKPQKQGTRRRVAG